MTCLLHPWSLLALALLAFNDHWYKGVGPSFVTGKLSDFAGLFYFPFVVLALVGCVARRRSMAKPVFWFVGVWFAAAKTIPSVHRITVELAQLLVGDVSIVRDPSDALAVAMLIPAWWLYQRIRASPKESVSRLVRLPALTVAVLLTAATSKPRNPAVFKLIAHNGVLHAVVQYHGHTTYATHDGITWTKTKALPPQVVQKHKTQQVVFLATGESLERRAYSVWTSPKTGPLQQAWGISEDRRKFMRSAGAPAWASTDITTLPNDPRVVVVGLGTQGVLIRSADNVWSRHDVGPARATATRSGPLKLAGGLARQQWCFGMGAALLAWTLLSLLTWCRRSSPIPVARTTTSGGVVERTVSYMMAPVHAVRQIRLLWGYLLAAATAGLCAGLLLAMFGKANVNGSLMPLGWMIGAFLSCWAVLAVGWGWQHHKRIANAPGRRTYDHIEESLACGVVAVVPLGLWDAGVIAAQNTAVNVAAASLAIAIVFFAGRIFRTATR